MGLDHPVATAPHLAEEERKQLGLSSLLQHPYPKGKETTLSLLAYLIWSCRRPLVRTSHLRRRSRRCRCHCMSPEKERRFCLSAALQQKTDCHRKQRGWFQICWRSVEDAGFVSDRRKNTREEETLPPEPRTAAPPRVAGLAWPVKEGSHRCRRTGPRLVGMKKSSIAAVVRFCPNREEEPGLVLLPMERLAEPKQTDDNHMRERDTSAKTKRKVGLRISVFDPKYFG